MSRRDSFITHRAFCDALAEETARLNAANAHVNLNATTFASNSLNYHFVGSNLGPAAAMAQHFSSIFKPLSSSSSTKDETVDPQNPRGMLPLWLGTPLPQSGGYQETLPAPHNFSIHDHNLHQLSSNINILNPHNSPLLVPGSNPRAHHNYPLNWVFGNKISTPLSNNNNCEEAVNTATSDTTTTSLPSLYSSQNPQTSSSNASHIMSATALLQKATQIGVTSSNPPNDQFFLGNFGLMKGNNAVIEINNVDYQGSNKYNGGSLFGTPNSSTTNLGSDVEGSSPDDLSTITMHQPAAKRQKLIVAQQDSTGGGQTRDFLGVSSNPISCNPPSINGWI